jgi:serine/threonine-protein kinase
VALSSGTRLGPYEIQAAIGAGGMGEVYRATDTSLGRQVAIKVLPDAFAQDAERLARFEREAKTLAALNHPHIAAIYGFERSSSTQALVMELVEGEDLSAVIARGPIPLADALPIATQIADALEAAHEQGIIHRDLKPANIKVRPDGTVKVLDFGLAKLNDPKVPNDPNVPNALSPTITSPAMMTGVGMILGTAAYMSPEQARGRAVDKRADIWAFGCVLFEMLTGQRAFAGDDVAETLGAVIHKEPDWSLLPGGLPAAVRTYVRRCLQKNPRQRLDSAQAMRLALEGAFDTAASSAPVALPPPLPLWRRMLPIAFTVVVCALIGAAAWRLRPEPPPPPVTRSAFLLREGQTWSGLDQGVLAVSPDGARLVYVANGRLYGRSLSELEATPIPGSEGATGPVFSPDGQSLAFFAADAIKRMPIAGGAAVTLCPVTTRSGDITWGPDGIVFAQAGVGILRVSPSGGTPEVLVRLKEDEAANATQILPGGTHMLFSVTNREGRDRWDFANVVVQALATQTRSVVVEGAHSARYLSTGHLLYARGGNLYAVPFDVRRLQVGGGGAEPVVQGVRLSGALRSGVAQFSVSDSGTLLFVPGPATITSGASAPTSTVVVSDSTGTVTPVNLPPGPYQRPRVSPDGTRLAVGIDSGQESYVAIYDLNGHTALRRLTFGGRDRWPIWSRDSQRVTFTSDRDGNGSQALFWQRADGVGPAERLTTPGANGKLPVAGSWSPKDETLLFEVIDASSGNRSLWIHARDGRKETPFAGVQSRAQIEPVFSPDGRWVAYGGSAGAATSVFVQPFPTTGALYQAPASRIRPFWSPNGRSLFYLSSPERFEVVSVTTQPAFAFGNPAVVPIPTALSTSGFDIMPDGRFVLLQVQTETGDAATPEIRIVLNWFEELKRLAPTN